MNTENTPTIYGTVTFEQFNDATQTVCKYVEGLANTYVIKDLITEEHRNKLEPDILMGNLLMMSVNAAHTKLINALKDIQAEFLEKKGRERKSGTSRAERPERTRTSRAGQHLRTKNRKPLIFDRSWQTQQLPSASSERPA